MNILKVICLILSGILPLLWTACGSGSESKEVEIMSLSVVPLPNDTTFLGRATNLAVVDSILYLEDTKGGETFLRAYTYPSLRLLCRFVTRGKGPEEMLAVSGYTADADRVYVFAAQEHKMMVYGVADILSGINKPIATVEYPQSCMPTLAFCGVSGGFALQNSSSSNRLTLIDSVGSIMAEKYKIPIQDQSNEIQSALVPYLWQSVIAGQGSTVVLGTKLGDVLEIYDVKDSSRNRIIRGAGGEPMPVKKERGWQMGAISGFHDVKIVGAKIYALFDGSKLEDYNGQDAVPKKIFLRVYDLTTGELQKVYQLDRYISSFDILPDGKTVVAADPNAEHQLCTFTLPD